MSAETFLSETKALKTTIKFRSEWKEAEETDLPKGVVDPETLCDQHNTKGI